MSRKLECRTFPLRVGDLIHNNIDHALAKSILKSKHQWIEVAIAEKLERDTRAV